MSYITYDTSVIVAYRATDLPNNFLLSAIVIFELIASAKDESERKQYEGLRRMYEKDGTLIVPNSEDWLLASKILYWLERGRKQRAGGKSLPKRPGATQRMALDTLIAVSARRYKATVVTENWDDCRAIQSTTAADGKSINILEALHG
ncbi:MAG: PIN domain-containing protein [Acidobacteria bacterium]|nr:PIN domain-containing protein [Acidobacteriota bacterium]